MSAQLAAPGQGEAVKWAKKRDANEPAIVKALQQVGACVVKLNDPGCPDLLVGYRGATYLLEVKLPAGPRGGTTDRTLTDCQVQWWAKWKGLVPVVVRTPDDAIDAIGATPQKPHGTTPTPVQNRGMGNGR